MQLVSRVRISKASSTYGQCTTRQSKLRKKSFYCGCSVSSKLMDATPSTSHEHFQESPRSKHWCRTSTVLEENVKIAHIFVIFQTYRQMLTMLTTVYQLQSSSRQLLPRPKAEKPARGGVPGNWITTLYTSMANQTRMIVEYTKCDCRVTSNMSVASTSLCQSHSSCI
jgi:hypothetical protein